MKYSKKLSRVLIVRRVVGDSMLPTLKPGQIVVACSFVKLIDGGIVVALLHEGREVVKRLLIDETSNSFVICGDNPEHSTDYTDDQIIEVYGGLLWPRRIQT